MKALSVIGVVAALGFVGCSDDEEATKAQDSARSSAQAGNEISRPAERKLVVEVSGDSEFSFSGMVELQIVVIDEEDLQFMNLGLLDLVTIGDGPAMFRAAFDLGGFDGAGKYQIPVRESRIPEEGEVVESLSQAFAVYAPLGDPRTNAEAEAALKMYDELRTPCTVEINDNEALQGNLTCPSLVDDAGLSIRLTMSWGAP
ncbi:MAG: hypothetical protein HYU28_07095 [Actinobacteria bacterium]|nr:hypothetical protein [Actinomycetota bacterium]